MIEIGDVTLYLDRESDVSSLLGATMNFISILIGLAALVAALVAFIPLVGWLNWLVIPVAVLGFVIGVFSRQTTGRNINLIVILIGMFRLLIGGGIL